MTQQPYYPAGPQQPYPGQPPVYTQPPAPAQQQPQQQYAPQYPGVPGAPQQAAFPTQQPPAQPLAQGSIDDYYAQPSTGGGKSISWSNADGTQKPIGTSIAGIVARDVTQADIQQETDQRTQQPKFFRDGRPKFVMKVPLRVQPSQEFPDGEATWWVKGRSRDELVRAMSEAGCSGAPKGGAGMVITLVQRKPMGNGMNPANVVQVQYQPPAGQGAQAPQQAPAPQVQQQVAEAPSPASASVAAPPVQYQEQPVQQQMPQQQAPAPAPGPQQAPAQQMPEGMTPEQQQLLAQLTGQQGN